MKKRIIFLATTALSLACIMFFIAYGCGKQNTDFWGDKNNVSPFTRIMMETAKTPNIKSASLTQNDKAILNKHLSKYTAFTIDKKELAECFQGGSGIVRLKIDKNLDWTIYLELNDMRAFDYKAYHSTAEGDVEVNEPFVVNTLQGYNFRWSTCKVYY